MNCQTKYSTLYTIPKDDEKDQYFEIATAEWESSPPEPVQNKGPWCPACMREAFDPVSLKCGHNFCRRCLANVGRVLLKDFTDSIKDVRVSLKCPLPDCRERTLCLPFVNGDFRFNKIRPTDKVPTIEKEPLSRETEIALQTYHIIIDVDVTVRKSCDLFDDNESECETQDYEKLQKAFYVAGIGSGDRICGK